MTTKLNAAKSIRNLASLYRDMEAAAEALETIGSIDQATAEAKNLTEIARAELNGVRNEVAAAREELAQAKKEATRRKDEALLEARNLRDEAQRAVEGKLVAAETQANLVLAEAKDRAAGIIQEAEDKRTELNNLTAATRQIYNELNGKVQAARQELADTEARLEKVRAELRKLLG